MPSAIEKPKRVKKVKPNPVAEPPMECRQFCELIFAGYSKCNGKRR